MRKEIDKIVEDHVQSVEFIGQEQAKKREETIAQLFILRNKTMRLITNAKRNLTNRCKELENINKGICTVQGHTYTEWEMHNGVLDRTWYYTRSCTICDKNESTENEPKEFRQIRERKMQGNQKGFTY